MSYRPLVLVTAPVGTRSGYGSHSRDIVRSLIAMDRFDIKIWPVRWGSTPQNALSEDNPTDVPIIKRLLNNPDMRRQPDIHFHIVVPNEFSPLAKYNIGITAGLEVTVCPPEWLEGLNKMNLNIKKLEKKLNIQMKNKTLLTEALTHKSASQQFNNEKLEFLGDRVIGLILSKKLIDLYPNNEEGVLDKRFAKLVNRKTCASIAWSIGINNYNLKAEPKKKIKRKDEKILSDTCEALIGAIYLDSGFKSAENFVLSFWKEEIKKTITTEIDSKTKLQEYSLKNFKKLPIYKVISFKGPPHNPQYKVSVKINNSKLFYGFGVSKKIAEHLAAGKLIKGMNIK